MWCANRVAIYTAIVDLYEEGDGLPCTIREIRDRAGISSVSVVTHHLRKLQEEGRIRRNPGIARSIRPAKAA